MLVIVSAFESAIKIIDPNKNQEEEKKNSYKITKKKTFFFPTYALL